MDYDRLFAVVIATYKRVDGSSRTHLANLSKFLKKQTCQNFHIFLIGDHYEDEEEFLEMVNLFPKDKIYAKNMTSSYRKNTFNIQRNKWTCGGIMARYYGIKQSISEGYHFYVHLDDDDLWTPNHLQTLQEHIEKFPECDFLYTSSRFFRGILPREHEHAIRVHTEIAVFYNNLPPRPQLLVNSSTCVNLKKPIKDDILGLFETRFSIIEQFKENKTAEFLLQPFDMEKWEMINHKVITEGFKTLFIPEITCIKITEGNIPQ